MRFFVVFPSIGKEAEAEELARVFARFSRAKNGERTSTWGGCFAEGQKIVLSWLVSIVSPRPLFSFESPRHNLPPPRCLSLFLLLLLLILHTIFNFRVYDAPSFVSSTLSPLFPSSRLFHFNPACSYRVSISTVGGEKNTKLRVTCYPTLFSLTCLPPPLPPSPSPN